MPEERLTDRQHWDDYWEKFALPAEIGRDDKNPLIRAELDVIEKYFPRQEISILEVGGAPGQYLAYFHRQFGYAVSSLDYSPQGCALTAENFRLLGIKGKIYEKDLFGDLNDMPAHDAVFSMGLVEHFEDLPAVIGKHLALLKPGGLLMIGMPNFRGLNHYFIRRLAPRMLARHNLRSMDINTWKEFEARYKLETLFKGHVGGFEPMTFMVREDSKTGRPAYAVARMLNALFHHRVGMLRKINNAFLSGYIMGIYRKPAQ